MRSHPSTDGFFTYHPIRPGHCAFLHPGRLYDMKAGESQKTDQATSQAKNRPIAKNPNVDTQQNGESKPRVQPSSKEPRKS
ncbi:MAG: hypothetical protein ACTHMT_05205 [Verrucomicrobiota bacterium]